MTKISEYLWEVKDGGARDALHNLFEKTLYQSDCSHKAITISEIQADETGLDAAAAFQHGTYSTALAYGTQTDHLVMKSMHVSAAATDKYVFGDINRITTSAASTGYMMAGYNYLSVGHDLVNGYATRSRLEITATCEIGEQVACLATATVAASATLTGSGNVRAGLFELNIGASAAIATECHCIEVRPLIASNIVGVTAGIRINVNCSSVNYLDYGLDIRSMSAQQTAAIRILATPDTNALACAIHIEGQDSSTSTVTNAICLVGTVTNVLDFAETNGSQGACTVGTYNSGYDETPIACFKVDMAGTAGYVYIHDTVIGVA